MHSGTLNPQPSAREIAHGRLAKTLAQEGIVLLKNDGLLPLTAPVSVALLGSGAGKTVKGGIGSGDVNNRETVSIYRGLTQAGAVITSKDWLEDYKRRYEEARKRWKEKILEDAKGMANPFDAYAQNPFSFPDGRAVAAEEIKGATAAIYVISRIAGEGRDRRKAEGDYSLSQREREDLRFLDQANMPVILIINSGAPIELTGILEKTKNIRAILFVSLPGQEGGHAIADVLLGRAVPGGKLTATWARHYDDYPCAESFGYLNGNLQTQEYREGIYVGYRYFDSFGVQPLFPFGYGLSYTTFALTFKKMQLAGNCFFLTAAVKNTGKPYSGKEVVQVYITLPQTGTAKEYQRLAGFARTKVLYPGETQELTVCIEQKQLASYREEEHGWIIEKGKYGVWIGANSAELTLAALLDVPETTVIERTGAICPKTASFQDMGASAFAKEKAGKWLAAAQEMNVAVFSFLPHKEDLPEENGGQDEEVLPARKLAQELPVEELLPLLYGNIAKNSSTLGSAGTRVPGSAGETTEALENSRGIRSLIMADGPAGLRLRQSYDVDRKTDTVYGAGVLSSLENGFLEEMQPHSDADVYYQYCTAFPVGTMLAQSWDVELMKAFGRAVAVEMKEFHIDLWLAPGMNIQRNPLCGRNFEYYSEDPFLSGMMAAAVTEGVQSSGGCGVTLKHFACNNQEDNRMGVDSCISERALREIYLRGFEIAVKKSPPAALMSAYNRINGIYAANNRDLCTVVAREEWGFSGVIMSDWNTTVPEDGAVPWKCAAAGNDIIMPGNPEDAENIRRAYRQGILSERAVRSCAARIFALIQKLEQ